jgi:hypothetical protein
VTTLFSQEDVVRIDDGARLGVGYIVCHDAMLCENENHVQNTLRALQEKGIDATSSRAIVSLIAQILYATGAWLVVRDDEREVEVLYPTGYYTGSMRIDTGTAFRDDDNEWHYHDGQPAVTEGDMPF